MAAPVVAGSATAYAGYTLGSIVESVLNARGMTADAAVLDFTPASANTILRVKRMVRDGLAYLYAQRERWYPLRMHDVTAQAQVDGYYSRIAVPSDAAVVDGVAIAGEPLDIVDVDTYFRNLRPTAEGGGMYLTDSTGAASHALFRIGSAGERVLEILPRQTAVFTATVFFRSSGAALTDDADVIVLPLPMQPLLVMYVTYFLTFQDGDVRGAREAWAHFQDRLDEVSFIPPSAGTAPRITSVLPTEN